MPDSCFHEHANSSFLAPAWTGKDQQQIGRHWLVTCQFHKGSNLNFWPPQRRHLRVSRSTKIHWSLPQMENQHLMHQECQTVVLETDYFLPTSKELDASKGIRALCSCKDLARLIVHLSVLATKKTAAAGGSNIQTCGVPNGFSGFSFRSLSNPMPWTAEISTHCFADRNLFAKLPDNRPANVSSPPRLLDLLLKVLKLK